MNTHETENGLIGLIFVLIGYIADAPGWLKVISLALGSIWLTMQIIDKIRSWVKESRKNDAEKEHPTQPKP